MRNIFSSFKNKKSKKQDNVIYLFEKDEKKSFHSMSISDFVSFFILMFFLGIIGHIFMEIIK